MKQMHTYHYNKFAQDPHPIKDMLGKSTFQALMRKAQRIQSANALLQGMLPEDLAPYCRLMNIAFDTAVIETSNANIATRLRYMTRELLNSLRYHDFLRNIKKIKVKVHTPARKKPPQPQRQVNPISGKSGDLIRESAESIDNPSLRDSLLKLAKHGKK